VGPTSITTGHLAPAKRVLERLTGRLEPRSLQRAVRHLAYLDLEEVATEIREVEGVSAVAVEGHRAE